MSNSEALKRAFEARRNNQETLKALYDDSEGRDLTGEEVATEAAIVEDMQRLSAREMDLVELIEREARTAEHFLASPVAAAAPVADAAPSMEARLNALRNGQARSVEIGYEARDLLSNVTGDGEELVESELLGKIHELVVAKSPLMASSNILRTSMGNDIIIPRVTSYSAAALIAEAGSVTESDPQFDTATLNAYKYGFAVQISRELEQDSAFNVANFVTSQGAAALGRGFDAAISTGSGSSQPQGIDLATTGKTTAGTAAVTADELLDMAHSILPEQRSAATWVFAGSTILAIRKLKDGDGNYLWAPGFAGESDTLIGRPVIENASMAAMATGVNFGVFGDLSGFYVRLAGGISVDRSEHVGFMNDLVTYRFLGRIDSRIIDTTGIRCITNA